MNSLDLKELLIKSIFMQAVKTIDFDLKVFMY